MGKVLYRIWQCTWGIFQTLLGFVVFLLCYKNKHFSYHGSIVTIWKSKTSVSLA